jgi:hypothetical protein
MYSTTRAVYRIRTDREGPGDARRIVTREFADCVSDGVLDKLKLLISELVTSRIVNRTPDETERMIIDVRAGRVVRCAVVDHGPVGLPDAPALGVVEQLSDRWGLTRSGDETRTWFETAAA